MHVEKKLVEAISEPAYPRTSFKWHRLRLLNPTQAVYVDLQAYVNQATFVSGVLHVYAPFSTWLILHWPKLHALISMSSDRPRSTTHAMHTAHTYSKLLRL